MKIAPAIALPALLKLAVLVPLLMATGCPIQPEPRTLPDDQVGLWSINVGAEGFSPPGSFTARQDLGHRLRLLADTLKAHRARGFETDLVTLQESGVGGSEDTTVECWEGTRLEGPECLAQLLTQQTFRPFESVHRNMLAILWNTGLFAREEGPFFVSRSTPGYEELRTGSFLGMRLRHLATGRRFLIVTLHVSANQCGPLGCPYAENSLRLLSRFATEHFREGDGQPLITGDFNYSWAENAYGLFNGRPPFAVLPPPPAERAAIDLVMVGPNTLTAPPAGTVSMTNIGYFRNAEVATPNGAACAEWQSLVWNTEKDVPWTEDTAFSDHCALGVSVRLGGCVPGCEATERCVEGSCVPRPPDERSCACGNGEQVPDVACGTACDLACKERGGGSCRG